MYRRHATGNVASADLGIPTEHPRPQLIVGSAYAKSIIPLSLVPPLYTIFALESADILWPRSSMPIPIKSPSPSPSRPTPLESTYSTATRSFLQRDHARTQSALSHLLKLLSASSPPTSWLDLASPSTKADDQSTAVLKLYISANATLYSDPPSEPSSLPPPAQALLKMSPKEALSTLRDNSVKVLGEPLSPALITTLVLAALKLQPPSSALDFAHHLVEDWLTALPDEFVSQIASTSSEALSGLEHQRVDAARQGYLKVVELFVGEVLVREREWGMARGLLDGEVVMGPKRKEVSHSAGLDALLRRVATSV